MAGLDGVLREFMAQHATGGEAPPEPPEEGADEGGCTFFPGLLSEPAMTAHVLHALDEAYSQDLHAPCRIDERVFLAHEHNAPLALQGASTANVLPSLSRCHVSSPVCGRYADWVALVAVHIMLDQAPGQVAGAMHPTITFAWADCSLRAWVPFAILLGDCCCPFDD